METEKKKTEKGRRREEGEWKEGEGHKMCELMPLCSLLKSLREDWGSVMTKQGGESGLSELRREQLMLD